MVSLKEIPLFEVGDTILEPVTDRLTPPETFRIKTADFIAISENPRQRHTAERWAKAHKNHLANEHPSHYRAAIAVLPNGEAYKLDGHTRAHGWDLNYLEYPDEIKIDVYPVPDMSYIRDFYGAFDATGAAESGKDKLYSGYRVALGHEPSEKLKFLWERGAKTAIEIAVNGNRSISEPNMTKLKTLFPDLITALKLIEKHEATFMPKKFTAPLSAALLCSLIRDGVEAFSFWDRYQTRRAVMIDGEEDAVHMLLDYVGEIQSSKGTKSQSSDVFEGNGRSENEHYTRRFLYLYQKDRQKERFDTARSRPQQINSKYDIAKFMDGKRI